MSDLTELETALDYNRKHRLTASEGDAKDDEMFDVILEAAQNWRNLPNQCNVLSPETQSPCVLPPTRQAHIAGHESEFVGYGRAVWATTDYDWWAALTPGDTNGP